MFKSILLVHQLILFQVVLGAVSDMAQGYSTGNDAVDPTTARQNAASSIQGASEECIPIEDTGVGYGWGGYGYGYGGGADIGGKYGRAGYGAGGQYDRGGYDGSEYGGGGYPAAYGSILFGGRYGRYGGALNAGLAAAYGNLGSGHNPTSFGLGYGRDGDEEGVDGCPQGTYNPNFSGSGGLGLGSIVGESMQGRGSLSGSYAMNGGQQPMGQSLRSTDGFQQVQNLMRRLGYIQTGYGGIGRISRRASGAGLGASASTGQGAPNGPSYQATHKSSTAEAEHGQEKRQVSVIPLQLHFRR
jgi:hypothetical protein